MVYTKLLGLIEIGMAFVLLSSETIFWVVLGGRTDVGASWKMGENGERVGRRNGLLISL